MSAKRLTAILTGVLLSTTGLLIPIETVRAAPQPLEQKCLSTLGKTSVKVAKTVMKETAKCLDNDISGKEVGACPNGDNTVKIDGAIDKAAKGTEKKCRSLCSISQDVPCVDDAFCPPLPGSFGEFCSQGAKAKPFNMSNIGFPGPFCEGVLGETMNEATQFGRCTGLVAETASDFLIAAVYGSITSASGISETAQDCLKSTSKAAQKLTQTTAKSVAKCRDSINKGKITGVPNRCLLVEPKTVAKVAKAEQKLRDTIAGSCQLADILELDLCGNGVGLTTSIMDAQDCLSAAAKEIGDAAEALAPDRSYSNVSLIDAAYPADPVCGDGVANQLPTAFLLLGEECDGDDDDLCPGACLPPGDAFECTCGDVPRLRFIADGPATDSDAGWTGNSFGQKVGDNSGWIVTLSDCNCDAFTGATCTGTTSDSECNVEGLQQPFCDWDPTQSVRCDDFTLTPDGQDKDADCKYCDEFSGNAFSPCTNSDDCTSQCYDNDSGLPTGGCAQQSNCGANEVCRGQCRKDVECVIVPDGAPLPVASANTSVCSVTEWRDDITGTFDIVTGAHEIDISSFSKQFLGEFQLRPCPVCGGFCVGGGRDLSVCHGACREAGGGGSEDPCRFDVDCVVPGETCSSTTDECPDGFCELELICGGDNADVAGDPCQVFFEDAAFGTMSDACPPKPSANITGQGFPIDYVPGATTAQITVNYTQPCTSPGFELFDCICPGIGGFPTKPNLCDPACDTGPSFGQGCAVGTGGQGTTCAGGGNVGKVCDEDADCPGSACSVNPTHCEGDPATELDACTNNGDCGIGTCVDACPGGRCVPLCVPEPGDPEDGICASTVGNGRYRCDGFPFEFKDCTEAAANSSSCSATCSVTPVACSSVNDCPAGETCNGPCESRRDCESGIDGILGTVDDTVGAGECIADDRKCHLNPVVMEGGTTANGKGDPDNVLHVGQWCFGATNSAAVNTAAGFPGPGIIRRAGTHLLSVTSIP